MSLPIAEADEFASVVRAKGQASQTVLTMLARTNETQFKRQALGKLPELLKIIQEEQGKMKLIEAVAL